MIFWKFIKKSNVCQRHKKREKRKKKEETNKLKIQEMKKKSPKILILGAKGMLGSDLRKIFDGDNIVAWGKDEVDITAKEELEKKINFLKPNIIINAAAYTNVDKAEEEEDIANEVNGYALNQLSEICYNLNSILVHYSTDYVFDGSNRKGYSESDEPKSLNAYGRSKALGEKNIVKSKLERYYIIRSAWLFGPSIAVPCKNFVNTILDLAEKIPLIKVVNDQYGSPAYTLDLAEETKDILDNDFPFGFYHFTNKGKTTWYAFAKEIVRQGLKYGFIKEPVAKIVPCTSREYPRPASRPSYSILRNTKISPGRSWRKALKDYLHSEF